MSLFSVEYDDHLYVLSIIKTSFVQPSSIALFLFVKHFEKATKDAAFKSETTASTYLCAQQKTKKNHLDQSSLINTWTH